MFYWFIVVTIDVSLIDSLFLYFLFRCQLFLLGVSIYLKFLCTGVVTKYIVIVMNLLLNFNILMFVYLTDLSLPLWELNRYVVFCLIHRSLYLPVETKSICCLLPYSACLVIFTVRRCLLSFQYLWC